MVKLTLAGVTGSKRGSARHGMPRDEALTTGAWVAVESNGTLKRARVFLHVHAHSWLRPRRKHRDHLILRVEGAEKQTLHSILQVFELVR